VQFKLKVFIIQKDYTNKNLFCQTDKDCQDKYATTNVWNGIPTGNCNQTTINNQSFSLCEINAWCPVEIELKEYF